MDIGPECESQIKEGVGTRAPNSIFAYERHATQESTVFRNWLALGGQSSQGQQDP